MTKPKMMDRCQEMMAQKQQMELPRFSGRLTDWDSGGGPRNFNMETYSPSSLDGSCPSEPLFSPSTD
jgi:hypothetical protein